MKKGLISSREKFVGSDSGHILPKVQLVPLLQILPSLLVSLLVLSILCLQVAQFFRDELFHRHRSVQGFLWFQEVLVVQLVRGPLPHLEQKLQDLRAVHVVLDFQGLQLDQEVPAGLADLWQHKSLVLQKVPEDHVVPKNDTITENSDHWLLYLGTLLSWRTPSGWWTIKTKVVDFGKRRLWNIRPGSSWISL